MAEFYTVITTAGREAVAKATQAGEKVDITHMAVGDGGGVPVTPNENQTQLVNECWRGLVATYSQQGSKLIIDTYILPDEASFITREMGLFTSDGVLFAVCNIPEMRKVLPSEGAIDSFVFGMELDITDIDMRYIEIHTNPMLDFIPKSEKGQPDGVATLDENSKVLKSQIPELDFDPKGSAAIVQKNLNTHINNKQNPHGVTATQVGAYDKNQSLTSATAQLFGLSASAVPNDVLKKVKTLIDSVTNISNAKINVAYGSYVGDNTSERFINLGFTPKVAIVAAEGAIIEQNLGGIATISRAAYNRTNKKYTILNVDTNGFYVYHLYTNSSFVQDTNNSQYTYNYIAFY